MTQLTFISGEMSKKLGGRVDLAKYASALESCINMLPQPHGGVTRRSGTEYIAALKNQATMPAKLIPFEYSTTQAYIIELGEDYARYYKNGGQIQVASVPYELTITTNFTSTELQRIKYTQSADVLYLTHSNHAPAKMQRTSHTSWTLTNIDFDWPAFNELNATTITLNLTTIVGSNTTILSSAGLFTSNWVGDDIKFDIVPSYINVASYQSTTQVTGTIVKNLASTVALLGTASTTLDWARSAWNTDNGYPTCVMFFEERLMFAATPAKPQTVWGSVSGDYENFNNKVNAVNITDTDAITYTISADQVNAIRWMMPSKKLILGTVGGQWLLGGSNDEGLSPTNVKCTYETTDGVADIMPVRMGGSVMFVQKSGQTFGKKIKEFGYTFAEDRYDAKDLSILAEHLTRTLNIIDMDFQSIPNQVLWCVREDGDQIALTYLKEHEVLGWSPHTFDGDVESEADIPGSDEDESWKIIKRTISSSTKRYIERLHTTWNGSDVKDAFYVDCGLTYSGSGALSITGLGHLEGKGVAILADGVNLNNQTVVSGAISLTNKASTVHVGLPIISEIKTLRTGPIEVQGKIKRIAGVVIRFFETAGNIKIGSYWNSTSDNDVVTYNLGSVPITKDLYFSMPSVYDTKGQVYIRKEDPYPMTILAIIPKLEDFDAFDRIST